MAGGRDMIRTTFKDRATGKIVCEVPLPFPDVLNIRHGERRRIGDRDYIVVTVLTCLGGPGGSYAEIGVSDPPGGLGTAGTG